MDYENGPWGQNNNMPDMPWTKPLDTSGETEKRKKCGQDPTCLKRKKMTTQTPWTLTAPKWTLLSGKDSWRAEVASAARSKGTLQRIAPRSGVKSKKQPLNLLPKRRKRTNKPRKNHQLTTQSSSKSMPAPWKKGRNSSSCLAKTMKRRIFKGLN